MMSGLEPLAALGLACNIFQLIEVGCNTIKLAKSIYQSSSPVVDQALQDNAVVLSTISGEVKAAQRPANLSKLDKQLVSTADKCFSAARDLQEEVRFLLSNAKQNQLVATLKVVAKTTWRRRRLDRLKENLENAEKLMTKTLLAQIWSRTHAAELDLSNIKHDLRAFIQEYKSGSRDIGQLVSSESLITRKHVSASSKETLEAIDGVQKQVNRLTVKADVHIDHAKRERLLRSLKFPAFNDRRNQVSEAHEKTFKWIFVGDDGPSQKDLLGSDIQDSEWDDSDLEDLDLVDPSEASWDLFSNWLSSTSNVYWISGKPGSGKTTLVKHVLDHSRTTTYLNIWSPQPLIISHFFWRPGSLMQQSIKGLLCSLLYQLLENSGAATDYVLQNTQAGRSGVKDEHTDWSVAELRSTFLRTLHSYDRPICCFIDGLDEVHPTDGTMELVDLVEEIPRCRNAKLCLSSRPEPMLEERLSAYPHLRLQDLTRSDLQLYARDRVKLSGWIDDEAPSTGFKDNKSLLGLLVDKAEGVFLWLVLAIQSINKGFTYGDTTAMIRQRIDRLPGDLTSLYKDMWARACEDNPVAYREIAALYFRLILLGQHAETSGRPWEKVSSLLHLMLASTSVADQLLDAINKPSELVPEERLLQKCRAVERGLKLYCFGLIDVTQPLVADKAIGWYGTQYRTVWSRYGRRGLHFVHRTAKDFLLDTVDGAEILKHNSTPENSLFFTWFRAHLAISQLYAGTAESGLETTVRPHILLLCQFPQREYFEEHFSPGDPDRARTISYLRDLCSKGQLLCGTWWEARFCGGTDTLKATATICDEHLVSTAKNSSFSKSTVSEILLNVFDRDWSWMFYAGWLFKDSTESLIMTLLYEGADPNWRGTMFDPWYGPNLYGFSLVRTPFTEFLTIMLTHVMTRTSYDFDQDRIVTILRTLHAFLSRSANLGDAIHRVFGCRSDSDGASEFPSVYRAVISLYSLPDRASYDNYLIVAYTAYTVLKAVLDHLSTKVEKLRDREEKIHRDMVSLLVRSREYLSNWPRQEHSRVIGRITYNGVQDSSVAEDRAFDTNRLCYWSLGGDTVDIANALMGEMEKCLLDNTLVMACNTRKVRILEQVLQLPWTLQAKSGHEIQQLLAELGILARTDYETHDIQGWVYKFQEKLFADGRVVD